jgi:uncharacterized membrane protein YeaQ/YmgE (transglycosylase-associated protein family)
VNKSGPGLVLDILLGVVGAVIGGRLFSLFGAEVSGLNLYSMLIAVIGAIIVLIVYHAGVSRRVYPLGQSEASKGETETGSARDGGP